MTLITLISKTLKTKTIEKIKKKTSFFENMNEIDNPPQRLISGKKEKTQITNIRNETEAATTDPE